MWSTQLLLLNHPRLDCRVPGLLFPLKKKSISSGIRSFNRNVCWSNIMQQHLNNSALCVYSLLNECAYLRRVAFIIKVLSLFDKTKCEWKMSFITGHAHSLSGMLKLWGACPACTLNGITKLGPVRDHCQDCLFGNDSGIKGYLSIHNKTSKNAN